MNDTASVLLFVGALVGIAVSVGLRLIAEAIDRLTAELKTFGQPKLFEMPKGEK